MTPFSSLLASFVLEPIGTGRYRAPNAGGGHAAVVFGGQLLGQTIVAASLAQPDKRVKTVQTIFARGARPDTGVEIEVESMHAGRGFGSVAVTISQGDRLCVRSLVLLHTEEPDFIHHAAPMPACAGPSGATVREYEYEGYELGVVGGIDVSDPSTVAPAELCAWTRFRGAPDDPVINQALVAYTTDGYLIGTAMLPHRGVGQSQSHVTLATGVVSHTLTFHRPASAGGWFLLAQESPFSGGGRAFGRGHVFTEDGTLVASFVQDAMIRPIV